MILKNVRVRIIQIAKYRPEAFRKYFAAILLQRYQAIMPPCLESKAVQQDDGQPCVLAQSGTSSGVQNTYKFR